MAARVLIWLLLASTAFVAVPAQAAQKGVATDLSWGLTPTTMQRTGTAIADLGAQWASVDVSWRNAELAQGVFDTANLEDIDRAVATARAAGAKVLMTVNETPQWASGQADSRYPPSNAAHLGAFYEMLVARYGASVDAWQVWNEPNHFSFWAPDPRGNPNACAGYALLLKAAYPVIKAADPSATVLFAGLAFNDYPYVERCYELAPDIGDFFDAMVTHPYAMGGVAPETVKDTAPADGRLDHQTFLAYREVRASMIARGSVKPIWFTEMGWSTATDGHELGNVSLNVQADYLTRAYKLLEQDPYVQVAMWYSLRNIATGNDGPGWLAQLGLMRTDFTPKPAYDAFKAYQPPAATPDGGSPGGPTDPAAPQANTDDDARASSSLQLSARPLKTRATSRRQPVRISGRLRGARSAKITIRLQRRIGSTWRFTQRVRVTASSTGRFTRTLRLARGTRWRVRAQFDGNAAVAPAQSRFVVFAIRARR